MKYTQAAKLESLKREAELYVQLHVRHTNEVKMQEAEKTITKLIDDRRYDEDADRILEAIETLKVFMCACVCACVCVYRHIHTYKRTIRTH
jgi:hypothetical protein